ncbi:hypothetical protein ACFY2R_25050 [Micromonospora olivasterospora]|uniref:Uncharacterized protein n=1 Tax=Micromonospora olivasterospora TaxID=1880 RepID=A0A562I548_MICOL|nr:hypothetical protein [Micromonospora olivasterospora]TWH66139.1 hypothetical protein JD77_01089 [Micromonospora olivasterospora]
MSGAPAQSRRPAVGEGGHGLDGVADAGAFLARLVRLDPAALVRLRPAARPGAPGRTAIWGRLPWGVLAVRTVAGSGCGDVTVAAAELLARLGGGADALPARRDAEWRWPLPPAASRAVEALPAGQLWRIAEAAAGTLREAAAHGVAGRAVGQRALRDALLDHVAVVVTPDDPPGPPVEVAQRLVQGLVRMGFLGRPGDDPGAAAARQSGGVGGDVQVRVAGRWVGLVGPYGAVWSQKVADLAVMAL